MAKLPAFLFFPNDWRSDLNLCRVSKSARDTWMDMLCLMFGSEERGRLVSGGVPWTDEEISVAVRGEPRANLADLDLLLAKGVAVRDSRGCVFSKRMVRDEQERSGAKERMRKSRSVDVTEMLRPQLRPRSEDETVCVTEKEFEVDVGSKRKTPSLKFSLPSLGEIQAYCQERNNHVDPQQFFDYYTSNGWKIGRTPMRDWRATIRNWERNDFNSGGSRGREKPSASEARSERSKRKILEGFARNARGSDSPV